MAETPKARVAGFADLPILVTLARKHVQQSPIAALGGFDHNSAYNTFQAAILRPDSIVITSGTGYLIGTITALPFNSEVFIAQEVGWYEGAKGGKVMLNAFEEWAQEAGVKIIALARIEGARDKILDKVYRRYGYQMAEHHYIKEV